MDLSWDREIGRGSAAHLWLATDNMDRRVAVKFISGDEPTEVEQDALQHAKALARVSHRSVVGVYSVESQVHPETGEPRVAIIMEYFDSRSLNLVAGSFEATAATRFMGDVAEGLSAIHRAGLVHGDLHEGNVLIGKGNAKVIDILYTRSLARVASASALRDRTDDLRDFAKVCRVIVGKVPNVDEKLLAEAYYRGSSAETAEGVVAEFQKLLTPRNLEAPSSSQVPPKSFTGTLSTVPDLPAMPTVLWRTQLGIFAWKCSPVVVGNSVFVGCAGEIHNQPDPADGIYCVDAQTGQKKWFAQTPADANAILVSKGIAVTGCDDGSVVAVSASDGAPLWTTKFDVGVVGGPLKLSGKGSSFGKGELPGDPIAVVTYDGGIHVLDLVDGRKLSQLSLASPVIGSACLTRLGYKEMIVVPGESGHVSLLEWDWIYGQLSLLRVINVTNGDGDARWGTVSAGSTPLVSEGLLLQGLVRVTHDSWPPLKAYDVDSGQLVWRGRSPLNTQLGNLRHVPVVHRNTVLFAPAYSSSLSALSLQTGELLWNVALGQEMFEQWSGPVVQGDTAFLGRHDGYLHAIDLLQKRRSWSIFLGDSARAGTAVSGDQTLPEFHEHSAWQAGSSFPILATPIFDRGRLYVGTREGVLYCIGNVAPTAS